MADYSKIYAQDLVDGIDKAENKLNLLLHQLYLKGVETAELEAALPSLEALSTEILAILRANGLYDDD